MHSAGIARYWVSPTRVKYCENDSQAEIGARNDFGSVLERIGIDKRLGNRKRSSVVPSIRESLFPISILRDEIKSKSEK